MTDPITGRIVALATAVCWTGTAIAFEKAGKQIGSLTLNLLRLLLALIFISVYLWIVRGMPLPLDASAASWRWLLLSGLIGFCLGDLFLFKAFIVLGSRISMLIMSLVPPITALTGWLLMGEVLTPANWTGMSLTIAGVAIVVLERRRDDRTAVLKHPVSGILYAFGGAVGQAVGLVLSKFGMGDYNAFAATQIRIFAGIAGFAALFTVLRIWPRAVTALRKRSAMRPLALGSFFGPFLGVSLSLLAVQYIEVGIASTFMALVPVLIIPPAVIFLKEKITLREVSGAVMAVAGIGILFIH
ncbi:DMT family transporter [bacterium]|nr:DMT family transporter [bacterium]